MPRFVRYALIIFFITACALYARIVIYTPPSGTNAEIVFLPVGQGDSELVRVGRVNVLIDAGPR